MDKKIYLITIIENIGDNETAVTHEGVVIGDEAKAAEAQKKAFDDCLSFWMTEWEEDTLEDVFEIYKRKNKLIAISKNEFEIDCKIECFIEGVNEI